jgi:hypothetical protein
LPHHGFDIVTHPVRLVRSFRLFRGGYWRVRHGVIDIGLDGMLFCGPVTVTDSAAATLARCKTCCQALSPVEGRLDDPDEAICGGRGVAHGDVTPFLALKRPRPNMREGPGADAAQPF